MARTHLCSKVGCRKWLAQPVLTKAPPKKIYEALKYNHPEEWARLRGGIPMGRVHNCAKSGCQKWLNRSSWTEPPPSKTYQAIRKHHPDDWNRLRHRLKDSVREAEIIQDWDNGAALVDIGARFGITRQRVSQIARRTGRQRPFPPQHDCDYMGCDEWLAKLRHSDGPLPNGIGVTLRKFHFREYRRLHSDGRGHRCTVRCAQILERYAAGKGTPRIARELRMTQANVYRILTICHHVPMRPPGYFKGQKRPTYHTEISA
jgi:Mor family transcriptional regulator